MKSRAFAAAVVFAACVFCMESTAHAILFWKNKDETAAPDISIKSSKPNKDIRVTETADFIILFFFTGAHEKRDNEMGESRKYLEISYKFSIRAEDALRYFGGEQAWMKVRFLDSEGFALAEDKVNYKDLLRGKEHYGFAWVEERKAGVLRKADLQPLRQDEIPAAPRILKPTEEPVKKENLNSAKAPEKMKPAVSQPKPDAEVKPEVSETKDDKAAAKPPGDAESPKAEAAPESEPEVGLTRGGATNAEVTAVLTELSNKPPTAIPESREVLNPEEAAKEA